MKKAMAILCVLIGASFFALIGCANGDAFTDRSYSIDKDAVQTVTVQVTDRELEIVASEDDRLHIEYFDGEKEYLDIRVTEDRTLTVDLAVQKKWTDFLGAKPSAAYRKIKIALPDNAIVRLAASTTNENITVSALTVGEHIELHANGGDVVCERINAGKSIDLTVKNGDIAGSVVGSWDDYSIECKIKKGDCNLPTLKESGEKSFFADCNNGDINIEFVK